MASYYKWSDVALNGDQDKLENAKQVGFPDLQPKFRSRFSQMVVFYPLLSHNHEQQDNLLVYIEAMEGRYQDITFVGIASGCQQDFGLNDAYSMKLRQRHRRDYIVFFDRVLRCSDSSWYKTTKEGLLFTLMELDDIFCIDIEPPKVHVHLRSDVWEGARDTEIILDPARAPPVELLIFVEDLWELTPFPALPEENPVPHLIQRRTRSWSV
ncbi:MULTISPECIES: hypothetical protein [unclassified Neorhizobium]|uniref:hypothetical protein n=1 Tax=unclassified Neorhizobium TaxID=2629175 RepID=UPI001FF4ABB6|nr:MULTISPECIES: hypothetical protein [unclassified Neorhizobium]MCJ9674104.1 hypothetical protein [Neorhizobium sp. SHOUNA12B]MCJ9746274.1 hypothetical protein [Neorhizobium sp. SHOUNA12A]